MKKVKQLGLLILLANLVTTNVTAQNKYQTPCQQNPERYRAFLNEMEKKVTCMNELSPGDCHKIFLAGAGATGIGGALLARAASRYGKEKIDPKDIQCGNPTSSFNIFDIIFPKAFAFVCRIGGTQSAKELTKQYIEEAKKTLQREFEKEESQVKNAFETAKGKQITSSIESEVDRYCRELEASGNTAKKNAARAIRNKLASGDQKKLLLEIRQSNAFFFSEKRGHPIANEILENTTGTKSRPIDANLIATVENIFKDSNLNANQTHKALSDLVGDNHASLKDLDVDALVSKKMRLASLRNEMAQFSRLVPDSNLAQFFKGLQPLTVTSDKIQALQSEFSRTLAGLETSYFRSTTVASILANRAPLALFKVAAAASSTLVAGMTYAAETTCAQRFSDETGDPMKALAINYIKFDEESNCKIVPTINEKSIDFFRFGSSERMNLLMKSPELCSMIMGMEKDLISSQNKIDCTSDGFKLTNKETNATRTFRSLSHDQYQVSFSGDKSVSSDCKELTLSTSTFDVQKLNNNCQIKNTDKKPVSMTSYQDIQNATQGCSTAQNKLASTCVNYAKELKANVYEYAQISKCCSGNSNDYCGLSTAFNKASPSQRGLGGGSGGTGGAR